MLVLHEPSHFRQACNRARADGKRVGLVPTMGALHEGHLALVDDAKRRADFVVLTIFVNPMQFGPNEDFTRYPRTLESDLAACEARGVDCVFAPNAQAMYPARFESHVEVDKITTHLEGAHRPSHFRGVTTVVAKLFNLTGAATAIFGRKDYQQWKVLERMALDLDFPIEVIGHPIVRENDGLAMSSRNRYLSAEERVRALAIVTGLRAATVAWEAGERREGELVALVRDKLAASFDSIDYIALADADVLTPIEHVAKDRALLAVAARIGKTRLIDNTVLGELRSL